MRPNKTAIVGIGNCAGALFQGINHHKGKPAHQALGLMHWDIGGYQPGDITGAVK